MSLWLEVRREAERRSMPGVRGSGHPITAACILREWYGLSPQQARRFPALRESMSDLAFVTLLPPDKRKKRILPREESECSRIRNVS